MADHTRDSVPELLPDPVYFASLPKVVTSGAVILRDETGRFLIEKPNYRDHWLLPGGGVDPGEDARQCAQREVAEELGLEITVGRLLAVTWMPSRPSSGGPMGAHFVFDGGVIDSEVLGRDVVLQEAELDDWAMIDESQAHLLSPWGARRAQHALAVLRGDEVADLVGLDQL
jgi:8-oxo-dGTP pyrophosphatase MutT (NUDIX family)